MLENLQNYGRYVELVNNGEITVPSTSINRNTWGEHFMSIYNIMRDGIESERVQRMLIKIDFGNIVVDLYIGDYWYNLMLWRLFTDLDEPIRPKHVYFEEYIRGGNIKKYIDKFLEVNYKIYSNIVLNNIIDDTLWEFGKTDTFAYYLSTSMDCESFIRLWREFPETKDIMSIKMATADNMVPIEDMMKVGTELNNKLLDCIVKSDHCLSDLVKGGEGLNARQFKEVATHNGPKPNGDGGIFPYVIDSNFFMGGVNTPALYAIESAVGRVAQLIVKTNVGDSGYLARIIKLNNMDTSLHPDPNYDCHTKNFQRVEIKNAEILRRWEKSYYRLTPNGVEYMIHSSDEFLIGKTVFMRTPMTCVSHAKGHGICHRCYGDLYNTNADINVGEIAAEIMSAQQTQKMLSAKHLLEAAVTVMKWSHGFKDYFNIEYNMIVLQDNLDLKKLKIKIDANNIIPVSEYENEYNEYITSFDIILPNGTEIPIYTSDADNLYITRPFNEIIRKCTDDSDDILIIDGSKLEDIPLFMVEIHNNELTKSLKLVKDILDKNDITCKTDRHTLLQRLLETSIECKMSIQAVHLALLLSNQIRSVDDELELPDWEYPNEEYRMLTLNQALTKNPSITVSLSYERISKMLFNPLSFRKHKASCMDLFFMEKPQEYIKNRIEINKATVTDQGLAIGITFDDEDVK